MGTVKTHLQSLPSPLKEMALKNASRIHLQLEVGSLSEAITVAFCWAITPQKHEFWSRIKDKIVEIEKAMIVSGKYYNDLILPNTHGVLVHFRVNPTAQTPNLLDFATVIHKDMEELMEMGTEGAIKSRYFSDIKDEDLLQQEKLVEWGVKALSLTEVKYEL